MPGRPLPPLSTIRPPTMSSVPRSIHAAPSIQRRRRATLTAPGISGEADGRPTSVTLGGSEPPLSSLMAEVMVAGQTGLRRRRGRRPGGLAASSGHRENLGLPEFTSGPWLPVHVRLSVCPSRSARETEAAPSDAQPTAHVGFASCGPGRQPAGTSSANSSCSADCSCGSCAIAARHLGSVARAEEPPELACALRCQARRAASWQGLRHSRPLSRAVAISTCPGRTCDGLIAPHPARREAAIERISAYPAPPASASEGSV